VVKKERDQRSQHTSAKKEQELTGTRKSNA